MAYVDGYVLPVPEGNRAAYTDLARNTAEKLRALGAHQVMECWGQDVPHGKATDFYRATHAEEGEAVVFAWVVWPDKAARDAGWAAMMADPEMEGLDMPFDTRRMFWGGFEPIVALGQG
ncbi:DUF1428 domain-containing protein [Sphingomonas elodea]|uniref:DUF1428 domain-containing protein n=1 Tax=Sphingomonas elodea TaxID=179878 RepID=UPI00026303FA|nr:DUF1428 domain-containing protein [Sphingomonas elodea]